MNKAKIAMLTVAMVAALIFCCVGILCRRKDLFSAFNHPLVKKYPNISRIFGTAFICFSIVWLLGVIIAIM